VARLVRDGGGLGLGSLDAAELGRALDALAAAAARAGAPILRMELPREGGWRGRVRGLEPDTFEWRAAIGREPHPGAAARGSRGAKCTPGPVLERARAERGGAVDEVVLLDAGGEVVEGAISSLVLVDARGRARTPAPSAGAVASLGLAAARRLGFAIADAALRRADLADARELVALNAVRGARAIVRVDDRRIGDGRAGPWCRRLAATLAADAARAGCALEEPGAALP